MHLKRKTRNDASLHDSAFQEAHTVSRDVSGDGATAPRRRLPFTGKSWFVHLERAGFKSGGRYQPRPPIDAVRSFAPCTQESSSLRKIAAI